MTETDLKIIALMKGENPPQTVRELVAAMAPIAQATVFSKISALLNAGELTRDDLPWRKDKEARTKQGRPRDKKLRTLEKQVEGWIGEGGKDRVAAGKLLQELRMVGAEAVGPPVPEDKAATIDALCRMMASVGREWTTEAYNRMFPSYDTLVVQEATNGSANTQAVGGPTTC